MGLMVDSSALIRTERSGLEPQDLLGNIVALAGDQPTSISSVALTEFIHGIYRARNREIALRRRAFLEEILAAMTVYPYTEETALLAGRIHGEEAAKGNTIPLIDLMIGATALSLGFSVLTTNLRHFQQIPGLEVIQF